MNSQSLTVLIILFSLMMCTKIITEMAFEVYDYIKISLKNAILTVLNQKIYQN